MYFRQNDDVNEALNMLLSQPRNSLNFLKILIVFTLCCGSFVAGFLLQKHMSDAKFDIPTQSLTVFLKLTSFCTGTSPGVLLIDTEKIAVETRASQPLNIEIVDQLLRSVEVQECLSVEASHGDVGY